MAINFVDPLHFRLVRVTSVTLTGGGCKIPECFLFVGFLVQIELISVHAKCFPILIWCVSNFVTEPRGIRWSGYECSFGLGSGLCRSRCGCYNTGRWSRDWSSWFEGELCEFARFVGVSLVFSLGRPASPFTICGLFSEFSPFDKAASGSLHTQIILSKTVFSFWPKESPHLFIISQGRTH